MVQTVGLHILSVVESVRGWCRVKAFKHFKRRKLLQNYERFAIFGKGKAYQPCHRRPTRGKKISQACFFSRPILQSEMLLGASGGAGRLATVVTLHTPQDIFVLD